MSETTPETIIFPPHGIDYDFPAAEYHKLPLCSKHALDTLAEYSPMHLQWHRQNPPKPTAAMIFGSAVHTAVLEPEKFDAEFLVAGQCGSTVKKSGERCANPGIKFTEQTGWVCGTHGKGLSSQVDESRLISAEDKEKIVNIVRAIGFNRAASELLNAEGKNEASAFFTHPKTRTECKLRADGIRPGWECVLDIKTCENASRREFEKAIANYRYFLQAAFYQDGLKEVGIEINSFVFIACEKSAPYGVATYRLMDEAIQAGREEYMRDLAIYAECERTGRWHSYDSEFQDISLSKWKIRELIAGNQF
jgi:hypothetical protein